MTPRCVLTSHQPPPPPPEDGSGGGRRRCARCVCRGGIRDPVAPRAAGAAPAHDETPHRHEPRRSTHPRTATGQAQQVSPGHAHGARARGARAHLVSRVTLLVVCHCAYIKALSVHLSPARAPLHNKDLGVRCFTFSTFSSLVIARHGPSTLSKSDGTSPSCRLVCRLPRSAKSAKSC